MARGLLGRCCHTPASTLKLHWLRLLWRPEMRLQRVRLGWCQQILREIDMRSPPPTAFIHLQPTPNLLHNFWEVLSIAGPSLDGSGNLSLSHWLVLDKGVGAIRLHLRILLGTIGILLGSYWDPVDQRHDVSRLATLEILV